MAGLFKNKIIQDKLEKFIIPDLESKISIVKMWYDVYKDGGLNEKNETQCEQAFNSDFFVKILGYSIFPNNIYTIQPKDNVEIGGGQIPDATLGYFSRTKKRVIAVVEIKDANTSLDKSQHRVGNLSPIQQAFKYKPLYKDCEFVIATNFIEIRLFRDNQLDYEKFTLTDLINPNDNYFNFRKFYYLLSVENFITETGQSETERLLSSIRIEQEKITNKFYKEYKQLREDLIKDIANNNKNITRTDFYKLIVEKAQKVVDRIVFICFFEDSGLLPENKLAEVVDYAQKGILNEPIWDTLKKFFKAVDEGSERLGVPNGYNGELFKPDEELQNLVISDEICSRFVELSKFDFKEDLSVTILGHIFEQSITDLERLRNFSEGNEAKIEKKDSQRKKDGIFYTPEYIIDYLVKNSLGKYLENKEQEVLERHKLDNKKIKKDETHNKKAIKAYTEYQTILRDIKVLDPACGSGGFLVKAFDYLLEENKRVSNILAELNKISGLFDTEDYVRHLLQSNLYGVDLNSESVEITKLSLWLKSAKRGQKLITLKENIKCGNSLIDDPEVAYSKAFDWKEEFKNIMDTGGFDVIIGNPPYVFARGGNFNDAEKSYYYSRYKLLNYQINTFLAFIELSYGLLKQNGEFGFIIPNNWLTISSFTPLREFILKECADVSIYNATDKVFNQANVDTCLLSFKKALPTEITLGELTAEAVNILSQTKPDIFFENSYVIKINDSNEKSFNLKNCIPLGDIAEVKSGIVAYEVGKGLPEQTKEMKDNRVYHSIKEQGSNWLMYLEGADVARYSINWTGEYIKYGVNLAAKRDIRLFNQPRILVRQIPSRLPYCINAAFISDVFINDRNSNNIINIRDDYPLLYILGLINSSLLSYWFVKAFDKFQRKLFPQFKVNELEQFPIHPATIEDRRMVEEKVKTMMILINDFNSALDKAKELLKQELCIEKMPNKFDNFYEITFEEFLEVTKKDFTITKKSELFDYFAQQKQILSNLKSNISLQNQEINELVFKIYELTSDEIDVIHAYENSNNVILK